MSDQSPIQSVLIPARVHLCYFTHRPSQFEVKLGFFFIYLLIKKHYRDQDKRQMNYLILKEKQTNIFLFKKKKKVTCYNTKKLGLGIICDVFIVLQLKLLTMTAYKNNK